MKTSDLTAGEGERLLWLKCKQPTFLPLVTADARQTDSAAAAAASTPPSPTAAVFRHQWCAAVRRPRTTVARSSPRRHGAWAPRSGPRHIARATELRPVVALRRAERWTVDEAIGW